ncbi:MAG TPA: NF038122 family metalloprotease, partial [Phenylobacterium sp.]|nr:NF038122 family metalloprotease [Phenylobacterium sp.]
MAFSIKSLRAILLASAFGVGAVAAATSADAATIVLHDLGGAAPGTAAYNGFTTAANFWAAQIQNNVTINLNVGFNHLGPNILGSTSSTFTTRSVQSIENHLIAGASSSAIDQTAIVNLPALTPTAFGVGGLSMVTPGYTHPETGPANGNPLGTGNPYGIDNSTNVYDHDGTYNNVVLGLTTANAKALGY